MSRFFKVFRVFLKLKVSEIWEKIREGLPIVLAFVGIIAFIIFADHSSIFLVNFIKWYISYLVIVFTILMIAFGIILWFIEFCKWISNSWWMANMIATQIEENQKEEEKNDNTSEH